MEWQLRNANPLVPEWILHTPGGVIVARVAQADGDWSWGAGINDLGMILYDGREKSLEPARDAATWAAERIGHLARASWASHPGGGASLKLRGKALAIVTPSIYSDPRAYPGWMDWCIPGTRIGGECLGLLLACVVASREAVGYWSGPNPVADECADEGMHLPSRPSQADTRPG